MRWLRGLPLSKRLVLLRSLPNGDVFTQYIFCCEFFECCRTINTVIFLVLSFFVTHDPSFERTAAWCGQNLKTAAVCPRKPGWRSHFPDSPPSGAREKTISSCSAHLFVQRCLFYLSISHFDAFVLLFSLLVFLLFVCLLLFYLYLNAFCVSVLLHCSGNFR